MQAVVDEQFFPRLPVRANHLRKNVHECQVRVGGAVLTDERVRAFDLLNPRPRRMLGLIEMKMISVSGSAACPGRPYSL